MIEALPEYEYSEGKVIVANTESEMEIAVHKLRSQLIIEEPSPSNQYPHVLGFDTEWSSANRGPQQLVLIQLATEKLSVLFRFHFQPKAKYLRLPSVLRELLLDPKVLKVGQDIKGDWTMIHRRFPGCIKTEVANALRFLYPPICCVW
jgi:hypothetical protein